MHAFDERGFVEAIAPADLKSDDLLSVCTDHAIETGAEDIEVMDENSRLIRVTRFSCCRHVTVSSILTR